MSFKKLLVDRATIQRRVPIPGTDNYGNPVNDYTWGTIATNVPCKMTRSTHDLVQSPSYQSLVERWEVVFLPSVDIKETDRIVIDGLALTAGHPEKVRKHHLDVPCTRDVAI